MDWSNNEMNCKVLARRLFRYFMVVLPFSMFFTMPLSAQSGGLKDELSHSLSGTTVVSTILFGGRAAPGGYKSDFPVDTIYTTNNEVGYQMDQGAARTAIAPHQMQHYFDRGTAFQVSSVDLQDGWLELKLKSAGGDSARLRLMLGNGWQSKFDVSSIRARLACVLILDQKPQERHTATVPVGFGEPFSLQAHDAPSKVRM